MVDLEPFLEAPFEEASNLSFEALLLIGIGLLAAVAALGRSTVTMAAVAVYLCLIPAYVGFRVRVWDRGESADDGDDGSDVDASESAESDDESDVDGEADGSDNATGDTADGTGTDTDSR